MAFLLKYSRIVSHSKRSKHIQKLNKKHMKWPDRVKQKHLKNTKHQTKKKTDAVLAVLLFLFGLPSLRLTEASSQSRLLDEQESPRIWQLWGLTGFVRFCFFLNKKPTKVRKGMGNGL